MILNTYTAGERNMKKSNKVLWIFAGAILSAILILTTIRSINYLFYPNNFSSFYFNFSNSKNIIGNNKMASTSVSLAKFDSIRIDNDFDVDFNQGADNAATITSDENILPYVNIIQDSNQISIHMQPGISTSSTQPKKIIIASSTQLHQINLNGKTTFHSIKLNADDLTVNMHGKNTADIEGNIKKIQINLSGKCVLHLKIMNAQNIVLNIHGMGSVHLSGNTQNLNIRTNGKSTVLANDLIANNVEITGRGMSTISVHAVKTLSILTTGKSNISYSGNPIVSRTSSGDTMIEKSKSAKNVIVDSEDSDNADEN